jgi:hypothetical protein
MRFLVWPVFGWILAGCPGGANDADVVTWHDDVAPIVAEHCLSCHRDGDIAPFSLATYESAYDVAELMAIVTESRTMPPYLVDDGGECNSYANSRWLSDEEIATITAWAETGAARGEERPMPDPVERTGLAHVDAEFDIGVDFAPNGEPDEYRCFVVDPGIDTNAYLTGFEVRPGNRDIVHHVILYDIPDADEEARAVAFDAEDERAGYPCFGTSRLDDSFPVAAWAPGTPATRFPTGTGISLDAGRKLVVQVHYYTPPGTEGSVDRTGLALELAATVETPALNLLIPYTDLVLPPGESEVVQEVTVNLGDVGLPFDVEILGVFPHMHKLGTQLSFEVERADGSQECMTRVNRWNFGWQEMFFFQEPFELGPSDTITLRCAYDTSDVDDTVYWGEGTDDEMCVLGIYVTL